MAGQIPPDWTAADLWNASLVLRLACGRNHAAFGNKRRKYFCGLAKQLDTELDLRGLPHPRAPYGVGDMKPGSL